MSLVAHKSLAAMSLNSLQSIALLRVSEALNVLQPKALAPKIELKTPRRHMDSAYLHELSL
jgi:hypothetical protein